MSRRSPVAPLAGTDAILGPLIRTQSLARALALGTPSFVRRWQAVQEATAALHRALSEERARRVRPLLAPGRELEAHLKAGGALPPEALQLLEALRREPGFGSRQAQTRRRLPRLLVGLTPQVERFNRRWAAHLDSVSLEEVHQAQERYNRYYVLEREAALKVPSRVRFEPLERLDRAELLRRFPPLPELR